MEQIKKVTVSEEQASEWAAIPEDWAKTIDLDLLTWLRYRAIIRVSAEREGVRGNSMEAEAELWRRLSERFGSSEAELRENLMDVARKSVIFEEFTRTYGHLLPTDETGEMWIPETLIHKIFCVDPELIRESIDFLTDRGNDGRAQKNELN